MTNNTMTKKILDNNQLRNLATWHINAGAWDVAFINDRIICGDLTSSVALKRATKTNDKLAKTLLDAGCVEAWVTSSITFGGTLSFHYDVKFPCSGSDPDGHVAGIKGSMNNLASKRHE